MSEITDAIKATQTQIIQLQSDIEALQRATSIMDGGKAVPAKATPLQFAVQYWNYVGSPDAFGPDWQIRFNFTPVIKVPWGKRG